jgi:hypothetical protein
MDGNLRRMKALETTKPTTGEMTPPERVSRWVAAMNSAPPTTLNRLHCIKIV